MAACDAIASKRRLVARSERKRAKIEQWLPRGLRLVARVFATSVTSKRRLAARSERKRAKIEQLPPRRLRLVARSEAMPSKVKE